METNHGNLSEKQLRVKQLSYHMGLQGHHQGFVLTTQPIEIITNYFKTQFVLMLFYHYKV